MLPPYAQRLVKRLLGRVGRAAPLILAGCAPPAGPDVPAFVPFAYAPEVSIAAARIEQATGIPVPVRAYFPGGPTVVISITLEPVCGPLIPACAAPFPGASGAIAVNPALVPTGIQQTVILHEMLHALGALEHAVAGGALCSNAGCIQDCLDDFALQQLCSIHECTRYEPEPCP